MENLDFDVVVVGYGYAGAVTALSAASCGARVLLLEKAALPGGISICSGGGLRIAWDEEQAFQYLTATCDGKTPEPVLRRLAAGMVGLPDRLWELAAVNGAAVSVRHMPANYPLPGFNTFGSAHIEHIPGFDPRKAYPHVRASMAGALLFKVLADNVALDPDNIKVVMSCAARRLRLKNGIVTGVELADGTVATARGGVVLACGGFEAAADLQAQFWPGGPALNTAYPHNTGDGLRMAQAVGAGLWHMWHFHGSYGYRSPEPDYPYGIRVKRLPDWRPGGDRVLPKMAWILLDRDGRRFMNEYEPYLQDTGHRPLALFDPVTQTHPRIPAFLVTDEAGRKLYPLGRPTRNDPAVDYEWSEDNSREIANGLFRPAETTKELAALIGASPQTVADVIDRWNDSCVNGSDREFGRPPQSMHPLLEAPFYVAEMWPVVSNTQGGPAHDEEQCVLDSFGTPIPGLYVAGECSSAFGHLYMSGSNLAECFIAGGIAGRNAALGSQRESQRRDRAVAASAG